MPFFFHKKDKEEFVHQIITAIQLSGIKKGFIEYKTVLNRNVTYNKILLKLKIPNAIMKYILTYLQETYDVKYSINLESSDRHTYSTFGYYKHYAKKTNTFVHIYTPCKCKTNTYSPSLHMCVRISLTQYSNQQTAKEYCNKITDPITINYSVNFENQHEISHSAYNHVCILTFFTLLMEEIANGIIHKYPSFTEPFIKN